MIRLSILVLLLCSNDKLTVLHENIYAVRTVEIIFIFTLLLYITLR